MPCIVILSGQEKQIEKELLVLLTVELFLDGFRTVDFFTNCFQKRVLFQLASRKSRSTFGPSAHALASRGSGS